MESRIEGTWKALYSFDLQAQALADYEMANWYLCNHPDSHFLSTLVAARAAHDCRHALRNNELVVHFPDGRRERRTLAGAAELRQVLRDVFCVRVPDWPELDDAFERLAPRVQATEQPPVA
jgi:N-hydroxyarylamine O-acetyltransferase